MKKTNRFWVIVPAVVMLFSNAVTANAFTTSENTTTVAVVKPAPSHLNVAISKGDLAKVQQLVEIGVDVNKKDERGTTPLMYAILFNQPQIAAYLIRNGADCNAKDVKGNSISDYAEKSKSVEILKLVNDARKRR